MLNFVGTLIIGEMVAENNRALSVNRSLISGALKE